MNNNPLANPKKSRQTVGLLISGAATLGLMISTSITLAEEKIIAKVGEIEISERELGFAAIDLKQQFAQVPEEFRKAAILKTLIDISVLAKAAEDSGIADSEESKARINFLRSRALHNAFYQENAVKGITDEKLRTRYDKEVAGTTSKKQVDARHILVKTEEEAMAIIGELDTGKDFAELAKAKSTGPSGKNGGTLGYFSKGQMVPEFEKAAFALENGTYTKKPVKTQFGWHIILKQDERDEKPPKFEESKEGIRQILLREKYLELIKTNREKFKVEIIDEELKAGIEKLNAIR
jgi:peptidyl-prolyl cis-trans isomerase C